MARDNQYRLLWSTLSRSKKIKNVSGDKWWRIGCHLVYTWLQPWQDDDGRLRGEPDWVKANILPNEGLSEEEIRDILIELHRVNLIFYYQHDGEWFIQIVNYENHQKVRKDRYKPSIYPPHNNCQPIDNQTVTDGQPSGTLISLPTPSPTPTPPKDSVESLSENNSDADARYCPHREIINLYHEILSEAPKVRAWPEPLQKLLRTRWKEDPDRQNLAWWRSYFTHVKESPFLMGRETDFIADLEWVIRPKNMTKILNGRYHSKNSLQGKVSNKTAKTIQNLQRWQDGE